MSHRILVVGAGGHSRSVLDLISSIGGYQVIGLLEDFQEVGTRIGAFSVLGKVEDIVQVSVTQRCNLVAVAIGENFHRERVTNKIKQLLPTIGFPRLVHPSAILSQTASLADGVTVFAGAILNTNVAISEGAIINTGSILEHDCQIGSFSSVAPGATLGGNVVLREGSFLGLGSSVLQNRSVGRDSIIGAGSLVNRDIPSQVLAYGNPCVVKRTREPNEGYL